MQTRYTWDNISSINTVSKMIKTTQHECMQTTYTTRSWVSHRKSAVPHKIRGARDIPQKKWSLVCSMHGSPNIKTLQGPNQCKIFSYTPWGMYDHNQDITLGYNRPCFQHWRPYKVSFHLRLEETLGFKTVIFSQLKIINKYGTASFS